MISDEPLPDSELSEAEVVRTIYRMSGTEKKSCQKIADHLNRTGIPCGSAENTQVSEAGKRTRRTAPIWRPSYVRNMIVSRTYMGQHLYGKRSTNRSRKVIVREVPAIVSEEVWQAAQQTLRSNRINCKRNTRADILAPRPDQVRPLRADVLRYPDETAAARPLLPLQRAPAGPRALRTLRQEVPRQESQWRLRGALGLGGHRIIPAQPW